MAEERRCLTLSWLKMMIVFPCIYVCILFKITLVGLNFKICRDISWLRNKKKKKKIVTFRVIGPLFVRSFDKTP